MPGLNAETGNLIYRDTTGWVATDAIKIAGENVAIGSNPALSRLLVKGDSLASENDPIFEVKNKDGAIVFAVYDNGVTGSFAVGNTVAIGALSEGSFTMGNNITNNSKGSFVFGDASNVLTYNNTNDNSFVIRSTGGVEIYTSTDYTSKVTLSSGGTSWNTVSDKNKEENCTKLNSKDIYKKLLQLPVEKWNYNLIVNIGEKHQINT